MDDLDDLADVRVEESRVLGVRDHEPGGPLGDGGPDRVRLRVPLLACVDRDHLVTGGGGSSAVAGVGEDGRNDLVSRPFAARGVIRAHHAGVRIDALRAAGGLEREAAHAGDLSEHPLEAVEHLEHPLNRLVVLERMQVGDLRRANQLLVDLWAVLHRAGPEAEVDVDVVSERLLREAEIVAEDLRLAQLGQSWWLRAPERLRNPRRRIAGGRADRVLDLRDEQAALVWARELEQDRLVPARLVKGAQRHRSTSASSAARRSMSPFVCTSVTQ